MIKEIKNKIRVRLIAEYNNLFSREAIDEAMVRRAIENILNEISFREHPVITTEERQRLIDDLVDEFTGYGPIEPFLMDPAVTEIMINGPERVYVERFGRTELSPVKFDSEIQLMHLIHKILAPTRRHVDESYPFVDVSLKDGSRVNIILPPLALNGQVVTIRKFLKELGSAEDLIRMKTLDRRMVDFLIACIRAKVNIVLAGATGAGKTTTLNVLSTYLPDDERVITIEDTAELQLRQDHVVRLETRQPNIEGKGEVSIRDLFRNSLRMRPDRIILGEIRGGEALDMLQAICSGHTGSLAVLHANSPQDVVYRLETMILTSGVPIALEAIHRQIAAALHVLVQQEQLFDGSRKVTHIAQVKGLSGGQIAVEDLFSFEQEGVDEFGKVTGRWKATGAVPYFLDKFKKSGVDLPMELFARDA